MAQFEAYLVDLKIEIPFDINLGGGDESLLKRMLSALNHDQLQMGLNIFCAL
jgi:hypothetical protein